VGNEKVDITGTGKKYDREGMKIRKKLIYSFISTSIFH
jgi:hypothetical protein